MGRSAIISCPLVQLTSVEKSRAASSPVPSFFSGDTVDDLPALRAIPERPYEFATWKKARVNIDYHIEVEGHYYYRACATGPLNPILISPV